MVFQPIALIACIVVLVQTVAGVEVYKDFLSVNAFGCSLMEVLISTWAKCHSVLVEPGILTKMKHKLSSLANN